MRKNNFDFIRLIGALLVLYSHSFPLTGNGAQEPFIIFTKGQLSFGGLGVLIFFSISGFLITKSYVERNNFMIFLKSRFFRIIPALVPVVILTVFVLGPLVTNLTLMEYFYSKMTWKYLLNIFPVKEAYFWLPGVFAEFPNKSPNGSLWTLPLELQCYAVVALLGIFSILKKIQNKWFLFCIFVLLNVVIGIFYFKISYFVKVQVAFLFGGLYFLLFRYIYWNPYIGCMSLIGLIISGFFGYLILGWYVFGTYLMIYLSYELMICSWKFMRFGDISYGFYIYSFPVQQTLIYLNMGKMKPIQNVIMAFPIVFCFAFLSWHLLEKKAILLVRK